MFLSQQGETPYDLKFRLFGTPVRVHPFFWLVAAIFGWHNVQLGLHYLLLWVACVFFSILLHEFGHVWMGRVFGVRSHIVLQGMCGLAIPDHEPYNRWRRVAISLAGPGIQLAFCVALFALIWVLYRTVIRDLPEFVEKGVGFLLWINIVWPLFNLLPVWPLDGGKVARELFVWRAPYNGVRNSLVLSIATCVVLVVHSATVAMHNPLFPWLPFGSWYTAILFGLLGYESFQLLQAVNTNRGGWNNPNSQWP